MALNAPVVLQIPQLPNSDIWFANAQAWNNYWNNVPASVTLSIATIVYNQSPFDANIPPANLQINGIDYALVTTAQLASLVAQVNALNEAFKTMRNELKTAGLITNAQ